MIRLLFTTIILTMLAQPAWAMSNEVLYKKCKPFAERGFELDLNGSTSRSLDDALCLGYILAVIEQANYLCSMPKVFQTLGPSDEFMRGVNIAAQFRGSSAMPDDVNNRL